MKNSTIKVSIVGASGYTGEELVRLLLSHPAVVIGSFYTSSKAGETVAKQQTILRRHPIYKDAVYKSIDDITQDDSDVVFFATPHGVVMQNAKNLLAQGKVVIDLGADFRIKEVATFNRWYGEHTAPDLLPQAVYGLPELLEDKIKDANLIACPGCYATAIELSLIPLIANNLVEGEIIADAKSGVSGAGRRLDRAELLLAEMHGNYKSYALGGHRHLPEIEQTLQGMASAPLPKLTFVPHLLPIVRGLYANLYIGVASSATAIKTINDYWADAAFIEVLPNKAGGESEVAQLSDVVHTNKLVMSLHPIHSKRLLVCAALDNLVKGASGQAIQNMNIRFGLPQTTGLSALSIC